MKAKPRKQPPIATPLGSLGPVEHWAVRYAKEIIFSHDGVLLRDGKGSEYWIARERLLDAPRVLAWVIHLGGKGWITRDHLRALVMAAEAYGAKVNWSL